MSKVLEDRRSLWKIACWWVWRIGNLLRKANHVGVSMKTKDQGTRGPGWKIIIATSSANNQHYPLVSQSQQPKSQRQYLELCSPACNFQRAMDKVASAKSRGKPEERFYIQGGKRYCNMAQCTMLPLLIKSCLKSSKLRPILNGKFCHAFSKNIGLKTCSDLSNQEKYCFFVILKL